MRSLIILLLLGSVLAANVPAGAQQTEKTLLWRISGNGMPRPSYLFGTLHLKARKLFNFPDSLYTALDNTEVFALEINPDSMSNMLTVYMERLVNKKDVAEDVKKEKKLRDILTPAELRTLRENLPAGSDIDPEELTMKQAYLMKDKLTKNRPRKDDLPTFMDGYLYTIAKDKKKIISGVERLDDQLNILENLNMGTIDPKKMVNYFNNGASIQDQMIQMYIDRDLEGLQRMSDILPEQTEEIMLTSRNKNMLRSMDSIMHLHSLFCAVGALHLPGKHGLITLLRAKGYTVEPVICNTYTNGAEYEFKTEGQDWVEVVSAKDGFSIKMPGQPNDVNAASGTIVMKMYYDLATSRCYTTCHVNVANNNPYAVKDAIDAMGKKITAEGHDIDTRSVSNGNVSGKEYFYTGKSNIRYHVQILGNNSDLYMLGIYAQSPDTRSDDAFFNSFRLISKSESANISKVFDDIRLSASVPEYKAVRSVNYPKDSSEKQIMYTIVDPTIGAYYFIVCNEASKGYNFNNDTVFLYNFKEKFQSQDVAVYYKKTRLGDCNSYDLETASFKNMKVKSKLIFDGNREYSILVQCPDNEKALAQADSFLQSIRIQPTFLANIHEEIAENNMFSTWAPTPFVEDTSGYSDRDTTVPAIRIFRSYDTSALLTYEVSVKRLSHYYWKHEDSVTLKNWLERRILDTDSTPVFSYSHTNGMVCGEAVSFKKYSDKIHRVKVIGDGRTRYLLDCTYPSYWKDNKRIDSFYSSFKVLKRDAAQLQSSPKLLFADLHSADSATRANTLHLMDEVYFSKSDVPDLLKELSTTFPDDVDSETHFVANRLLKVLKEITLELSLTQLASLYHDPLTVSRGHQFQALEMMVIQDDSIAAFKTIKQLLISSPSISGSQYSLYYKLKRYPALTRTFYPELLSRCGDSTIEYTVCNLARYLLDSGYLHKTDIESYIPLLIDKSSYRRQHPLRFSNAYMLPLLAYIGTPKVWEEIRQYQYQHDNYLRYTAIDILTDSFLTPEPWVIDSVAADRDYRLRLYSILNDKNLSGLFPKRYLKQQYFAESYLSGMDEDGMYTNYTLIGEKTALYRGKKQKFFLYMTEEYDDNKTPHLGVAGPFSNSSTTLTIDYNDNACGFLDDQPDLNNLDNQLKVYLIRKKIDESRHEETTE